MRELFNINELVQVAIEDESSGVAFYSSLADRPELSALRGLFSDLARQEKYHKKRFEDMLETMRKENPREEYPGEYVAYLHTLTTGRAFPDVQTALRKAHDCKSDTEALDLALRFERDTLILLSEMESLVPAEDRAIVQELAREEKSHLVALGAAKTTAVR